MPYALAPGISFCDPDGRFIFLDLPHDRYFSLGDAAGEAFARLVAGDLLSAAHAARLETLKAGGVLVWKAQADPPRPCGKVRIGSAISETSATADAGTLRAVRAATCFAKAKFDVRWHSLHRLCYAIAAAKARLRALRRDPGLDELAELSAAFQASARIIGTHDHCLALSLAMTRLAMARSISADLHLGVKLRPFQAHAWVQVGEILLSDRLDTVRPFTPILII